VFSHKFLKIISLYQACSYPGLERKQNTVALCFLKGLCSEVFLSSQSWVKGEGKGGARAETSQESGTMLDTFGPFRTVDLLPGRGQGLHVL
jgi:hypothetical protein